MLPDDDDIWHREDEGAHSDLAMAARDTTLALGEIRTHALREGISEGRDAALQDGFNQGYVCSLQAGYDLGQYFGVIDTLLKYQDTHQASAAPLISEKIAEDLTSLKKQFKEVKIEDTDLSSLKAKLAEIRRLLGSIISESGLALEV